MRKQSQIQTDTGLMQGAVDRDHAASRVFHSLALPMVLECPHCRMRYSVARPSPVNTSTAPVQLVQSFYCPYCGRPAELEV